MGEGIVTTGFVMPKKPGEDGQEWPAGAEEREMDIETILTVRNDDLTLLGRKRLWFSSVTCYGQKPLRSDRQESDQCAKCDNRRRWRIDAQVRDVKISGGKESLSRG